MPGSYAMQAYDAALLIDSALKATGGKTADKEALARGHQEGRLQVGCAAPSSSAPTASRSRTSIW